MSINSRMIKAVAATIITTFSTAAFALPIPGYVQTNLVSDIPGNAAVTDANLVNPWGIAESATSPFWISDNGAGVTTLYDGNGTIVSLVVSTPAPGGGPAAPTGQVFNGTSAFNGDNFLLDTEDGTLLGWRGALGTTAEMLVDNSGNGAAYKGLAIGTVSGSTYAYGADFTRGSIDVFPGTVSAPALSGNFTDPNLPAGYGPFNIQNLGGKLYVTYADQSGGIDEVDGAGLGFVDSFDLNGNFLQRIASQGPLNAPWGLALTPSGWGLPAGDLLIGNFGDGAINVYDPTTGTLIGTIADAASTPLINDGLWGLTFGNGGSGGSSTTLYLTAGLNNESDGLFAKIDFVPEPASPLLLLAGIPLLARRRLA